MLLLVPMAVPLADAQRRPKRWKDFYKKWRDFQKKAREEHERQEAKKITGKPGTYERVNVTLDGVKRRFRLYVPDFNKKTDRLPLVLLFHGMGGNGEQIAKATKFEELAKEEKFMVCCPDAVEGKWAIGKDAHVKKDIRFVQGILQEIDKAFPLNRNRIYAAGMSMGGYFCHHLAQARSKSIAAIAAHSGGLGTLGATGLKAKRKYPVLLIHGTKDEIVPVDRSRKAEEAYKAAKHVVRLIEVEGLGHKWAEEPDATRRIWQFFRLHWLNGSFKPASRPARADPDPDPEPDPDDDAK